MLVHSPHETAWRETLHELMEARWNDVRAQTTWTPEGFTSGAYQELVAGKSRHGGALAALEYFAVPDAAERVGEYAESKQQKVVALIEAGQFRTFPDAVRLLPDVHGVGIRVATASSSKNAKLMLAKLRLDTLIERCGLTYDFAEPEQTLLDILDLDLDISGRTFEQGKPHPEIFLTACRELGVAPQSCFVVEDAVCGVTAGKAGGLATVGIARAGDEQLLRDAGADLVVTTLDDVDRGALAEGRLTRDRLARPAPA